MKRIFRANLLSCIAGILAFLGLDSVHAQNLVINPSFETHTDCPEYGTGNPTDQLLLAPGWSSNIMAFYFNTCAGSSNFSYGVPSNTYGSQAAATGDGYAGICAYQKFAPTFRPYICGTLSSPLVVGSNYTVSYKVCLAEGSTNATNNLGVDFSTNNNGCYWGGTQPAPPCLYPITNTPSLLKDFIVGDSVHWKTLTWNYTATETSQYIMLGVFGDVPQDSVIYIPNGGNRPAYYYFDDVSVVENIPCTVSLTQTDASCFGSNDATATATINSGDGPFTYSWSPTPGGGQGTPNATGLNAQTYTLTVSNSIGNCTASATILQPDSIALAPLVTHPSCGELTGSIAIAPSGGNGTYTASWNNPPSSAFLLENLGEGSYTVVITDGDGCTATRTFQLQNTGLAVSLLPTNPTIVQGDSIQLSASGGVTYSWSPTEGLSCTDCADPYASPETTSTYIVTGTNANGCTGTASVTVKVEFNCSEIFVPTIFSPNGDGQNDDICVLGGCISKMVFAIYNRWGEKVFETTDPEACWDGDFKGRPIESGAYAYKLQATQQDGTKVLISGGLTVIR